MVVMLDTMAGRYHKLPSQLLREADTFDLFVMEKAMQYHNERSDPNYKKPTPELTEEEMYAMINQVKAETGE